MENGNQNLVSPQPISLPSVVKKWYQRKSVLVAIILTIIAGTLVWTYFRVQEGQPQSCFDSAHLSLLLNQIKNFPKPDKNGNCPSGYLRDGLYCPGTPIWCEPSQDFNLATSTATNSNTTSITPTPLTSTTTLNSQLKIIQSSDANIKDDINRSGQLVGKLQYFINSSTQTISFEDTNNAVYDLTFTKPADNFLVSDDSSKIVWGNSTISTGRGGDIDSTTTVQLFSANIDGSNQQLLLTKNYQYPNNEQILKFTNNVDSVYFAIDPDGLGGYILFSGHFSLFKLNLTSKTLTTIVPIQIGANGELVNDISLQDDKVVSASDNNAIIHFINGGSPKTYPLDVSGDFTESGNLSFSPNGTFVAYGMAKNSPDNPDEEKTGAGVINLKTGDVYVIEDNSPDTATQPVWISDIEINFGSYYYHLDSKGSLTHLHFRSLNQNG